MQTKHVAICASLAAIAGISSVTLAQVNTGRPAPILIQSQQPVNPNAVAAANAQLNTANLIAGLDARVKALEAKSAAQANTIATLQTRLNATVNAHNGHRHNWGSSVTAVPMSSFYAIDGRLVLSVAPGAIGTLPEDKRYLHMLMRGTDTQAPLPNLQVN